MNFFRDEEAMYDYMKDMELDEGTCPLSIEEGLLVGKKIFMIDREYTKMPNKN